MRTKTLLLSAAALAAGLLSSQAQNVYSANVVGYVTTVYQGGVGDFTLSANPFDDGKGNTLTNIVDPNNVFTKQSEVLTWDAVNQTYDTVLKTGSPLSWGSPNLALPPGIGFFVRNGSATATSTPITNTYVGTVIVPNQSYVTNTITTAYSLQGSPIPYNGNLAYSGQVGGDTNMNFGASVNTKQSAILTWDVINQTFDTALKTGSPTPTWGSTVPNAPGSGFFIYNKTGPATNVVEQLNLQ